MKLLGEKVSFLFINYKHLTYLTFIIGIPLSKQTLYRNILDTYLDNNCQFLINVLQCKNYLNSLHKYAGRVLKQLSYIDRKKTISQKIPVNWDNLVREGAADVRKYFREKKVEVVLAGDEFF